MLAETTHGTGDVVDRTGAESGDVMRSKKGDFLLTVDPQWCHGAELRVVIEAKNRSLSWRDLRQELDAAKQNRSAAMALAIFTPQHAPKGVAPFDVRYGHVVCVIDPDEPDATTLGAAVRLARLYALTAISTDDERIDPVRVLQSIAAVKAELDRVRSLKVQLTSIRNTANEVAGGLDQLRDAILSRVADAEAQVRTGDTATGRTVEAAV